MKIFLGVLENDIIAMDVGLSDVDPRRLAAGEWDEVVFVGELLCWLGKKSGLLPMLSLHSALPPRKPLARERAVEEHEFRNRQRTASSSTHSTTTNSHHSLFSATRSVPAESDTTIRTVISDANTHSFTEERSFEDEESQESIVHRPRCIHEVEELSYVLSEDQSMGTDLADSTSSCDCDTSFHSEFDREITRASPVRYTGWLSRVDDELEVRSFEDRQRSKGSNASLKNSVPRNISESRSAPSRYGSISSSSVPRTLRTPVASGSDGGSNRILTRHNSPTEYTLALLNERAKLLAELASLSPTSRP